MDRVLLANEYEEGKKQVQDFYQFKAQQYSKLKVKSSRKKCRSTCLHALQKWTHGHSQYNSCDAVKETEEEKPQKTTASDDDNVRQQISSDETGDTNKHAESRRFETNSGPLPAADRELNILVRCPDGYTCCQIVKASDAIGEVKKSIASKKGIPSCYQKLYHQGKLVSGSTVLGDIVLENENDIHLTMLYGSLRGGSAKDDLSMTADRPSLDDLLKDFSVQEIQNVLKMRMQKEKPLATCEEVTNESSISKRPNRKNPSSSSISHEAILANEPKTFIAENKLLNTGNVISLQPGDRPSENPPGNGRARKRRTNKHSLSKKIKALDSTYRDTLSKTTQDDRVMTVSSASPSIDHVPHICLTAQSPASHLNEKDSNPKKKSREENMLPSKECQGLDNMPVNAVPMRDQGARPKTGSLISSKTNQPIQGLQESHGQGARRETCCSASSKTSHLTQVLQGSQIQTSHLEKMDHQKAADSANHAEKNKEYDNSVKSNSWNKEDSPVKESETPTASKRAKKKRKRKKQSKNGLSLNDTPEHTSTKMDRSSESSKTDHVVQDAQGNQCQTPEGPDIEPEGMPLLSGSAMCQQSSQDSKDQYMTPILKTSETEHRAKSNNPIELSMASNLSNRGEGSDKVNKETDICLSHENLKPDMSQEVDSFCHFLSHQFQNLQFHRSEPAPDAEKLELQHVFVKKGGTANELEKKLVFLILYKDDEDVDVDMKSKIWQIIQDNQEKWINQLDSKLSPEKDPCRLRSGQSVKTMHVCFTFSRKDIYRDTTIILIKDSRIDNAKEGYFFYDKKETIKVSVPGGFQGVHHISVPFDTLDTIEVGHLMKGYDISVDSTKSVSLQKQNPRRFDHEGRNMFYIEGCELDCFESGPSSSLVRRPCHEFKFLATEDLDEKTFLDSFIRKTLRFACGCLNRRTNGTIHFGVVDEESEKAKRFMRQPCEIVGIPIKNPVALKNALGEYKMKCFSDPQFADMCIHEPEFIEVRTERRRDEMNLHKKYVIEVDIEPRSDLTKGKLFSVKIPKVDCKGLEKAEEFERAEASTVSITKERMKTILQNDMEKYDRAREKEESLVAREASSEKVHDSTRKLKERLGTKHGKLDESLNRVLVISKFEQDNLTGSGLRNKFSFLRHIPFKAIIDFNGRESCEGYQYDVTEKTRFDFHNAEDYQNDDVLETVLDTPQFVFASDSKDVDWKKWRNSSKKRGLDQFTQQLSKAFPDGSVVVMFLILQGFSEMESITFGHFCTHFSVNQAMYYVEDDDVADTWVESITRGYIEEPKALERGVRGLPWEQFRQVIEEVAVGSRSGNVYIPISPDTLGSIDKRNIDGRILKVVNAKESDELKEMLERDPEDYRSLDRYKQNVFYQGQPVCWKNFWFQHVVERDAVEKLRECVNSVSMCMDEEIASERIHVVKLFSCRGAGGSTAAQHLLWVLSREKPYRYTCCIINAIERKTVDELWNFSNVSRMSGMPVIVLVDEFADVLLSSLVETLGKRLAGEGHGKRSFIFIAVKRSDNPVNDEASCKNSVAITYDLSGIEKHQFMEKFNKLRNLRATLYPDEDFELYADNNLVSFMILLKPPQERRAYTKHLVKQTLPSLTDRERNMLTYLSLLHLHDPYPVFLACFDCLMIEYEIKSRKYICNWTSTISPSAAKCLRDYDISEHTGTGRAIAITHPFLSEDILQWKWEEEKMSIADIAIEFLDSPLFTASGAIRQHGYMRHISETMKIVLKKRRTDEKIDIKSRFSPLIEKVLKSKNGKYEAKSLKKEDLDAAAKLLDKGFHLFEDPVLAQQIARLYIYGIQVVSRAQDRKKEEYLEKAKEYARKALEMKSRSSFFMDTMGQIHKCALRVNFHEGRKNAAPIDVSECKEAIKIAQEALNWFRRSQEADKESRGANKAGYFGEMDVMFYLLDIISNCQEFQDTSKQGNGILQRYLCHRTFIPREIREVWPREMHDFMKTFKERYFVCMAKVDERMCIFKLGKIKPVEDDYRDSDIRKYTRSYITYFSSPDDHRDIDDKQNTDEVKHVHNWNYINRFFQGRLFKAPFNNSRDYGSRINKEKLAELKGLVEKNFSLTESPYLEDIFCKISISMAMHSPHRFKLPKPKAIEEYHQVKTYLDTLYERRFEKCGRYEMYSYLFKMMFSWPHSQPEMSPLEQPVEDFLRAQKTLRENVDGQGRRVLEDPELHLYMKMPIRTPKLKPTTLFFLGNGWGLDVYVHVNEFIEACIKDTIIWEHASVTRRLKRLTGYYSAEGKISVETLPGRETFDIEKAFRKDQGFSRGKVTFCVGFSWRGAMAFDVKRTDEEIILRPFGPATHQISDESDEEEERESYNMYKIKLRRLEKKRDQAKSEEKRKNIEERIADLQKLYDSNDDEFDCEY